MSKNKAMSILHRALTHAVRCLDVQYIIPFARYRIIYDLLVGSRTMAHLFHITELLDKMFPKEIGYTQNNCDWELYFELLEPRDRYRELHISIINNYYASTCKVLEVWYIVTKTHLPVELNMLIYKYYIGVNFDIKLVPAEILKQITTIHRKRLLTNTAKWKDIPTAIPILWYLGRVLIFVFTPSTYFVSGGHYVVIKSDQPLTTLDKCMHFIHEHSDEMHKTTTSFAEAIRLLR